jgi:hypothetical protein
MLVSLKNRIKSFKKIRAYVLLFMLMSPLSAYHNFVININDNDLETGVSFDLGQWMHSLPIKEYFIDMNYLYMENSQGEYRSVTDLDFILKKSLPKFEELSFGFGTKFVYAKRFKKSFTAMPLGIHLGLNFDVRGLAISINALGYYAPKPLTFNDGDKYSETEFNLGFEVIERGLIYIGYREIRTYYHGIDNNVPDNYLLNKTPFIGFKLGF